MPKVSGWSRVNVVGLTGAIRAWEHDETGEVVYVSPKVPKDGYYVMHLPDLAALKERQVGERIGFDIAKDIAFRIAVDRLRDHPNGGIR